MIGDTYWAVRFEDMLAVIEEAEIRLVKGGEELHCVKDYIRDDLEERAVYVRECAQDEEGAAEVVELECAQGSAIDIVSDYENMPDDGWLYSERDTLWAMRFRDREYGVQIDEPVEEAV